VAMAVPRVMANFEKAAVKKGSVQASGPEVLPPQNETGYGMGLKSVSCCTRIQARKLLLSFQTVD
jgi:hypothetical protein